MHQNVGYFGGLNFDNGHAATLAWSFEFKQRWTLIAEAMRVRSDLGSRRWVGAPVPATERQLQLALRLEL
jgi:hypothetical protein